MLLEIFFSIILQVNNAQKRFKLQFRYANTLETLISFDSFFFSVFQDQLNFEMTKIG